MTVTGKAAGDRARHTAQPRRQLLVAFRVVTTKVAAITTKQFVSANAGQNHFDILPGKLGNQKGGDEGRVRYRFVHMPQQLGQQIHHVGAHNDLAMLRAKQFSNPLGIRQLVIQRLRFAAGKADGVGSDWLRRMFGHKADHRAGINTARKECTNWHITHHLHPDGLFHPRANLINPLRLGYSGGNRLWQPPISPLPDFAPFNRQQCRRRKLSDALENTTRRRDVPQVQVTGEHRPVQFCGHTGQGKQGLGLGGKCQSAPILQDV